MNQIHGTMRAVQLAFNANRVLGGTLKAGDHVDIYGEIDDPGRATTTASISQQTVAGRIITQRRGALHLRHRRRRARR